MTRDLEIKQAIEQNLDVSTYTTEDGKMLKETFYLGAKWADNHPNITSLWHDVSEKPNESADILFIAKNGKVHKVSKVDNSLYSWLVDNKDIKRWAYIIDLLPKGGDK